MASTDEVANLPTGLFIRVRGGPKGFEYRLDDGPKSQMILVSDLLRNLDSITFEGASFAPILKSRRLRIQVLTVLGNLKQFDLDLDGIGQAHAALRACR